MHAIILDERVIRGLKAKLLYESCTCTPIDKCDCDVVMKDIKLANEWIASLEGEVRECHEDG
jgi:hypothetical protein|tara:strand:- start:983 stop:1168 length:186 start_codon:yes stop_codon:yes gene_type:complete